MVVQDPTAGQAAAAEPDLRKNGFSQIHGSVAIPLAGGALRKTLAYAGPGYLVAVGYMDPGNWATDLAGGSVYGYALLCVILASSLMAMVLQVLSTRLGIATGRDLAQMCRLHYSRPVALGLWALCEIAICACDLAEVIGGAIALNLLFGAPLVLGVCLMAGDALLILLLQRRGFRQIEAVAIALIVVVAACFAFEIALARPAFKALAAGFLPHAEIIRDPAMLYIAIGIIGATVMPHNLYLHSSIVQTRRFARTAEGKREAARFAGIDTIVALAIALFVNAAILVTAAAVFHAHGRADVAEIQDAYLLLAPLVGLPLASTIFALALLAAGQNATITATLAGQIVMEGFLGLRLRPWLRRLVTRLVAIIPAAFVASVAGASGMARLLVLSQVILSLQLPFALVPLLRFTGNAGAMGPLATPSWLQSLGWVITAVIILLNLKLLAGMLL